MEHKLIVELNEEYNFYKATCTEGCYITDYTEDKDIKDLLVAKEICLPATYTVEQIAELYHCISEDEYNELIEKGDKAIEEEINNKHIENEKS